MESQKGQRYAGCCGVMLLTAVGAFIKIVIPVGADIEFYPSVVLCASGRPFGSGPSQCHLSAVIGGGNPMLRAEASIRPTFAGFLLGFALAAYVMGKIVEWMHASNIGAYLFSATVVM